MYSTTVHFLKKSAVPLNGSQPVSWNANIVPVELGLNGERGSGSAVLWYSSQTKKGSIITDNYSKFYLSPTITKPSNKLTVMFNETEAKSVLVSGGKGSSLALLSSIDSLDDSNLEFKVPYGFVVSASAFDLQLRRNPELAKRIKCIKDVAYGNADGELQSVCQSAIDEFKSTPLDKDIARSVTDSFEKLTNGNQRSDERFAVRSSAIGEDADDASSAGQNETFLGCRNIDEVLDSIKLCWASLFTYQSVVYRRQHVQPIDTQMSVVVQYMVPSDCAGVLFTRHPGSGDPSKILITANYGLGESVVSGAVDPDTYLVYRKYNNCDDLKILEKSIGTKAHYLHMSASEQGNAVVQKELSQSDQTRSCLTDEQIVQLSRIGILLEKFYGNARDIEWAIHQNTIYLLQSRPITTLNSFTNWELLHEFDSAVMSGDDMFSFANVGEVFPEVMTPLTISTITTILNKVTSEVLAREKDYYGGLFGISFNISHFRLSMDVYKVFLAVVNDEITVQDKIQAISVCGHEFVTPEMHRIAKTRNGAISAGKKLYLIWDVIESIWSTKAKMKSASRMLTSMRNRYSKENIAEFKDYSARQFNEQIELEIDDDDRLGLSIGVHSHTSKVSVFYQLISMLILLEGSTELKTEHYADIALMLGSCNDVESAEVPRMLEDIANSIYLDGKSAEFENVHPKDGVEWLKANCVSAAKLVADFMAKHGHRSLKEFDLASYTWEMNPEQVIEMVQASCRGSKQILLQKKDKVELTNNQIVKMLKTPKSNVTRKVLSYLLPRCKSSVQNRETTKSSCIAVIHEIRKAYRHLADLMYKEGLLPEKDLIFYLSRYELLELLQKPQPSGRPINKSAIINKAMRRSKLFPTWNTYHYEEVNRGIIKPINQDENLWTNSDKMVTGTPVCEGVITGRACVLKNFSEVSKIQSGDILVTHSTDIGWSPYFPILGGVVTELGGLISHGAVVAREYGLPCIVGATGATSILKFGDKITLNAAKGFIVKVDESET